MPQDTARMPNEKARRRSNSIVVLVLVLLALVSVRCSRGGDSIKIGFFGPLTGNTATAGQSLRNGALIAIEEMNAAGGLLGKKITLVEYDDRSSPEQAVKSAMKLVTVDRVHAIVGSLHSGNILASAPILEEFRAPTIGSGTSPKWLEQGYKYLFRSIGNSGLAVRELALYATSAGMKRVAILHANDEYGRTGADDFARHARDGGLEIVTQESFTHGDRDFTGQFARIRREKPDAVMLWALGDDLGALTKQLRQTGYAGPILGSEGYSMPQVTEIAGAATDGVVFAAQYLIPETPDAAENLMMRRFLDAYVKAFNEMPASDNAYRGYDAARIIGEAIRRAQSVDSQKVRDAIENLEGFEGIAGSFTFKGRSGEGIHSSRIFRIAGGNYSAVP